MTSQQLKAMVAKGKLRADYQIRRGSEGPWVPAGRVKGLFPETRAAGQAKQAVKPAASKPAAAKPAKPAAAKPAKAGAAPPTAKPIPAAQAAATPPAGELPVEMSLGGHGKHAKFNLDQFVDAEPLPIQTRKSVGVPGLKKAQQKKAQTILLCVIGGGLLIVTIVFTIAFAKGWISFSSHKEEAAKTAEDELEHALAEKKTTESKTTKKDEEDKQPTTDFGKAFRKGSIDVTVKPATRGAPPEGVQTDAEDVLLIVVTLKHAKDEGAEVEFKGWRRDVSLKDDTQPLKFLGCVVKDDANSIKPGDPPLQVTLVFEPPAKKAKFLRLELSASAFGQEGMLPPFKTTSVPAAGKAKSGEKGKPKPKVKADTSDSENPAESVKPNTKTEELEEKTAKTDATPDRPTIKVETTERPELDLPPIPDVEK